LDFRLQQIGAKFQTDSKNPFISKTQKRAGEKT
jgi:hypothetical protein